MLEEDEEGLMKKNNAKPSIAEETAAAAKAAAAAAADVARASQEMLITKSEGRSLMISKSIYCSAVNTVWLWSMFNLYLIVSWFISDGFHVVFVIDISSVGFREEMLRRAYQYVKCPSTWDEIDEYCNTEVGR